MTDKKSKFCSIVFQPSSKCVRVVRGTTIREAARAAGVDIEGVCAENAVCGKCKVRIARSDSDSQSENASVSPVTQTERRFLKSSEEAEGVRLACQVKIQGDLVVYVSEGSSAGGQVYKEARNLPIRLHPAIKAYRVAVPHPGLGNLTADWERLKITLKTQCGLKNTAIDYPVLNDLQRHLREAYFEPTCLVWQGKEVIGISMETTPHYYGVALDIGTTTIAAYLCDLSTGELLATSASLNPQGTYGEDVMSRITYGMTHDGGLELLHWSVIASINGLIHNACETANIKTENIYDMTVVGNTCMHHLFLNIAPDFLGASPFVPAIQHSVDIKARELGLCIASGAYVHVLPVEAGFVGADNVAVLIAEEPYNQDKIKLVADIGTNGELILGNRERLLCCSCATGPAFEGGHIKFGMRAAPGAIESITIDRNTLKVSFKVIGDETGQNAGARGICGSAIIDILPELFLAKVIDRSGRFNKNIKSNRLRATDAGREFVIAWAPETAIGRDIVVTQDDIRAIQLAKAAMYAGAKIMMRRLGVERLDQVILAGAFGSHINKESAAILGLIPDCPISNIKDVGNAAGDGARLALLDSHKRREADRIARRIEYVELTLEPDFERAFAEAMWLPHMKDKFPNLDKLLAWRKTELPNVAGELG